jgi:Mg/Co/Ni transporter MgtE
MLLDAQQNMLSLDAPVLSAMRILDQMQAKIALVIDMNGKLVGSVVDGDVRRGLLGGHTLESPVHKIMHADPLVLADSTPRQKILEAMHLLDIKQVPLVAQDGSVTGIAVHDVLLGLRHKGAPQPSSCYGRRQGAPTDAHHPRTCQNPWCLWAASRFSNGFCCADAFRFPEFTFAINYLGHMIEDYFADGSGFGCNISMCGRKNFWGRLARCR